MDVNNAIELDSVNISFKIPHKRKRSRATFIRENLFPGTSGKRELKVLRDITIKVPRGQCVGIIGENGSGKSTLLKIISRILVPDSGRVEISGKLTPFLELGVGFQGELTARENIYIFGALMGIPKKVWNRSYDCILDFSELQDFPEVKIKNFSSGMYARLAFACMIHVDPDILVIDEIFAVGDESFRHKCIEKLLELKREGRTIVIVSHRLGDIKLLCDRLVLLQRGSITHEGEPDSVAGKYLSSFGPYGIDNHSNNEKNKKKSDKNSTPEPREASKTDNGFVLGAIGNIAPRRAEVKTGDDVEIEMELSARHDYIIESPHIAFIITDEKEKVVYKSNTHLDSFNIPGIDGKIKINLRLERIPLMQGTYRLDLELWGGRYTDKLDSKKSAVKLIIGHSPAQGKGLTHIRHNWQVL